MNDPYKHINTGSTPKEDNPGYSITASVTNNPNYSITADAIDEPIYSITTTDNMSENWIYFEEAEGSMFRHGPDVHMKPDPDQLIAKGTMARILGIRRPEKSLAPKEEMGKPVEDHTGVYSD